MTLATITYKCPNCDAGLVFSPESQDFFCEYCQSHFTKSELDGLNPDKQSDEKVSTENAEKSETLVLYKCPACGAEVITESTTVATFCYYCHNPVILEGKLEGDFKPDGFIPFKKTREEITEEFLKWIRAKKFVPRGFFCKSNIEKLSGVYYPYWVTDYRADGDLTATATKVRTWSSGDTMYTETSYYDARRSGDLDIKHITNKALKSADVELAEAVLPYDYGNIKNFESGYLSGFLAEKRDIDSSEVKATAEQAMRNYAKDILTNDINGYSSVTVKDLNLKVKDENWRYVLLPVWTLTYKGRDNKIYYYAVNGQTGEVVGKLPLDKKKLLFLFLGLFFGVGLIAFLGGWFFL